MPNSMPTRQLSADFVKSAKAAVANATLLTSPAIEDVIHKCSEAPAIGIDTEFVRERTFYPRPGLVQISNGHQVWLLDAVAVENRSEEHTSELQSRGHLVSRLLLEHINWIFATAALQSAVD